MVVHHSHEGLSKALKGFDLQAWLDKISQPAFINGMIMQPSTISNRQILKNFPKQPVFAFLNFQQLLSTFMKIMHLYFRLLFYLDSNQLSKPC